MAGSPFRRQAQSFPRSSPNWWMRRTSLPMLVLFVALVWVVPAVGTADDAAFVAGVEDLPLMPGLTEVRGAGVVFDKPGGRIVEAYAEGTVSRAAVLGFYEQTLPQLGWQAAGNAVYRREGERLEIVFLGGGGDTVIRFTLQPD